MDNSNAKVSIKTFDNGYSLVVNGEESETAIYGEPLEMETTDKKRFIAFADAEGEEVVSLTEFWAYECLPVVDVPILEEEGEEDDEEDDEETPDDEDEDEEVEEEAVTDQTK